MKTLNNVFEIPFPMAAQKKKEIESKFLIWKDGKFYVNERFWDFFESQEEIIERSQSEGTLIEQGYMSLDSGYELAGRKGISVEFTPIEARLRRKKDSSGKETFTFGMKDDGTSEREDIDEVINRLLFESYWPGTEGNRLVKKRINRQDPNSPLLVVEFDVYTDRDLIVAEVEFESREQQGGYHPLGLDITKDPQYKNRNMGR